MALSPKLFIYRLENRLYSLVISVLYQTIPIPGSIYFRHLKKKEKKKKGKKTHKKPFKIFLHISEILCKTHTKILVFKCLFNIISRSQPWVQHLWIINQYQVPANKYLPHTVIYPQYRCMSCKTCFHIRNILVSECFCWGKLRPFVSLMCQT